MEFKADFIQGNRVPDLYTVITIMEFKVSCEMVLTLGLAYTVITIMEFKGGGEN